MSLFGRVMSLFVPASRRKVEASGNTVDTVQRTDHDTYWANASSGSANAVIPPEVRRQVWNRARMECQNSPWLVGMIDGYAAALVGKCPRVRVIPEEVTTSSMKAARKVEDLWLEHAEAIDFASKLRTQVWSRVRDGEGFAVLETDRTLDMPVQLDFAIYEGDFFGNPWGPGAYGLDLDWIYDGIRYDARGKAATYFRFREHPGAYLRAGWSAEFDPIPADMVCHLFKVRRAGQLRGFSEIAPALDLMVDLRRYRDAAVKAARRAASMSALLKSNMEPGEADEIEDGPFSQIPLPTDALMNLPDGWDATILKAEHPTQTYGDFTWSIMQEASRVIGRPVSVAAGDSSRMNYASGRLDKQTSDVLDDVDREELKRESIIPTFRQWYREARLIGGFLPRMGPFKLAVDWDGRPHVDPMKEAKAVIELLNAELLHEERYWSERYGISLDEAYEAQQRAISARERAGLPPRAKKSAVSPPKKTPKPAQQREGAATGG